MNTELPRNRTRTFCRVGVATIGVIYFLILVGGIVRASGAGMGCPDWPTCFGRWVPPVSESQLPADYQQTYADLGYRDTRFNVRKTWTEYLNRLLGVLTGLMIIATTWCAWRIRQVAPGVFGFSMAALLLVIFQGWLGSRVVASNLAPGMITLHMLVAQVIVCLVIYAVMLVVFARDGGVSRAAPDAAHDSVSSTSATALLSSQWVWALALVTIVVSLGQLLLGTQVREAVDLVAKQSDYQNRHLWIDNLPVIFAFHRYLSIPAVLLNVALLVVWFQAARSTAYLKFCALSLLLLVAGATVMGMSMDQLHLPMFAQPLHLWFASMILGIQFTGLLIMLRHRHGHAAVSAADLQAVEGT